jgi:uncharacterized protein YjbJ (UPF0337 family)
MASIIGVRKMTNKISAKASELKGKAKEAAGKATGDRSLEGRGKTEQVKGHAKGAVSDVKKAARKVKGTVTR